MKPSEIIDKELTTPVTERIGLILDEMAEDIEYLKKNQNNPFDQFGVFSKKIKREWEK